MNTELNEIRQLFAIATGDADKETVAQFAEVGDVSDLLVDKMNEYCDLCDPYADPTKKTQLFQIIAESVQPMLPKMVDQQFRGLATSKQYKLEDMPRIEMELGDDEVKKFVTRGAMAGVYRKSTLDKGFKELETFLLGGGFRVSLRDFLTKAVDANKLRKIILAQFETIINLEIQKLLISLFEGLPANNKHTSTSGFEEEEFDNVIATVDAYCKKGMRPVIMCTKRFAMTLPPASTTYDADGVKDIRNNGYVTKYKGCDVVILDQSFTDKTNTSKVVDDKYAYVFPSDKSKAIVHLGFQGQMIIDEHVNRGTQSREWQFTQYAGLACLYTNHLGMYKNNTL